MDSNSVSLMISGIQHYVFCPRQWALIHIEQAWEENVLTVEGDHLHRKVDEPYIREKRHDTLYVRAMRIHSTSMPIHGVCDMVEFTRSSEGISLQGEEGLYEVKPIEYKRGKPKTHEADLLQLTAQAICLEEMLGATIEEAALYYHEVRRRQAVRITNELRDKVQVIVQQMQRYYERRHTPKVRTGKHCSQCSLKNICLPELDQKESVQSYVKRMLNQ